MPLFINNEEIDQLITMKETMEALEILYREMGEGSAITAPRSDVHSPTVAGQSAEGPMAHYLKSMSGASPHFGTAALRFSSDIVAWRDSGGAMRREKLPMLPGKKKDGQPVALPQDPESRLDLAELDSFLAAERPKVHAKR